MTLITSFDKRLTAKEESSRVEQADIKAGEIFDDLTGPQRIAFISVTDSAARMYGHGSEAHSAAIDLARRQWEADTKEAREFYLRCRDCILRIGELTEELSDEWTALSKKAVKHQMAAE